MNPSKILRNLRPGTFRILANWFPPIRNSGVHITRISPDWLEWDLRLRLGRKTRNYVGTHYGGTLYSAMDPHFMLAWMHILGPDYIVWDKAADIRFRRPGKGHLAGNIRIPPSEVAEVKQLCDAHPKVNRTYEFQWHDRTGAVVAEVKKILHFERKEHA